MVVSQGVLDSLKAAFADKKFVHLPGAFSVRDSCGGLTWRDVNQILRSNRLMAPRMRVCKNGKPIPESEYMRQDMQRRGTLVKTLVEEKFYALLRDNATLVLDAIDQLHRPLDDFCAELERVFQAPLQVNAYMSWGETPGFNTHWDDHDVLIVQMEGHKEWFLYGESRKYPLYRDLHAHTNQAPEKLTWNKVIQKGDVLFIPRGHWHHAVALREPSLHLTFGFQVPTGLQVVDWLKERWVAQERVREDIPLLKTSDNQESYWRSLKNTLMRILDETSLSEFIADYHSKRIGRQRFSLPEAILSPGALPFDFLFQWNHTEVQAYRLEPVSGNLTFKTCGKVYEFSASSKPFFDVLLKGDVQQLGNLVQRFGKILGEQQMRELISELLLRGLIQAARTGANSLLDDAA